MRLLKHHFSVKAFDDILGYNSGVSVIAGPPGYTAWCYLVDGILIDSGIRHVRQPLLKRMTELKPGLILITHHHEDHSGNAGVISRTLGIKVYAHPLAVSILGEPFKIRPYQHVMWGKSDPVDVTPVPEVIETKRCRFRPIHTPGHSIDHTVYLDENSGRLFSGDLYIGERIKFFRADEVFEDQLSSLRHILTYDFDALLCSHRPMMTGGKEAIRRKLVYLENFYGTVEDLVRKGYSLKAVITQLDRRDERFVKWVTLNNACFSHMARSAYTLALKNTGTGL